MKLSVLVLVAGVGAAALAACNPYNPNLGDRPFRCGTEEPRCPDGYVCVQRSQVDQFCEKEGTVSLDGGVQVDAGPFVCADDSEIEPNDEIADAYVTGIPDSGMDRIELASLAVCPAADRDKFQFRIDVTGKTGRAEIRFNPDQGELTVSILAANGNPIGNGMVQAPGQIVAQVPNLPAGNYFAEVRGTGEDIENNYSINIEVIDD